VIGAQLVRERSIKNVIVKLRSMSKVHDNKSRAEELRECVSIVIDLNNDLSSLQTVSPDKIKELREALEKAKEVMERIKPKK
jgi:divalent metal cation (Fe/Co/Zn/Cd) transporter